MATVTVVTGNPLLDHLAAVDLQAGRINRCDGFQVVAGGKGLNVGRVLVRHGHRVNACGFAGGNSGEQFRAIVAAEGQQVHLTETAAPLRVGFLARTCADAGPTGLLQNGFLITEAECQACLKQVGHLLPNSDLVICSGSVAHPTADGLYASICSICAEAGVPCWVDSYGAPMRVALAGPHPPVLVKPNRQELDQDSAWDRAAELHISDGAAALEIRTPSGRWQVQPPPVPTVNPVGSGDSYVAALAHARLSGMASSAQWSYAAAAGALNASRMSVADFSPQELPPLAETVLVTEAK
jgi:fructose-1-phosphate kinase PfkB-like protein